MQKRNLPQFLHGRFVKSMCLIVALLIAFSGFAQPLAGPYTINLAQATSGTNFNNFNDFAGALSSRGISSNVTVTVAPNSGPYQEQVTFANISGSGPAAVVTINGNGNTITAQTTSTERHIIRLSSVSYFTIDSLTVAAMNATSATNIMGVHVFGTGDNININRVTVDMTGITSSLSQGIVASGSATSNLTAGTSFTNLTFSNNTIIGGGYGISFFGTASTGILMNNNSIYDFSSNGIYTRGSNGLVIRDNVLNKRAGTAGASAIQIAQTDNTNASVYNNKISHEQTSTGTFRGIYIFGGTGHQVYNNLIYDVRALTGTNVYGIHARAAGTMVLFNTVSFDHTTAGAVPMYAFAEEAVNTGTILKNNIFSISQPTSAAKSAILLSSTSTVTTAINSNNNVFYVPGGNVAMRGTTSYTTLADWQAASAQDAASMETNPYFISLTNPVPTSGIINNKAATGTTVTTDITGATRSATPDPGAYEFTPAANDIAVESFVSPTLPYCATSLNVQFRVANAGADPLTSFTINWTINGVAQTPYTYTGSAIASGASTVVTLGATPLSGTNVYTFSATASNPNGQTDANAGNNTASFSNFRRGMEGAFTVNATAPASGTNFTTIQGLMNDLKTYGVCSAITATVSGGPYTEQVVMDSIPGTSATNTVTIDGNGVELNFNPTVAASDHIFQIKNVDWVTVKNFVIKSLNATNGRGIHITGNATHVTVQNNTVEVPFVTSSTAFPILASGANYLSDGTLSTDLNITGNTTKGGYIGIQVTGDNFTNIGTKLVNSTISGNDVQDWYFAGIQLSYTDNIRVLSNQISRPTRTAGSTGFGSNAGISIPAGSTNYLINKNKIYNLHVAMSAATTSGIGIYMGGTSTAQSSGTVQNNLVYGMTNNGAQYGIQLDGTFVVSSIYHNTIVLDQGTPTNSFNTVAMYMSNSSAQTGGANIKNNIFYVTRGGLGNKRIMEVASASSVFTSDYNVGYLNASTGTVQYGKYGTPTYTDLAAWQTGTTKDAHSLAVDPVFASDYKPTNTAVSGPVMNTASVGVTDDIVGVTRSATPDPGAYEFTVSLPVTITNFTGKRDGPINKLEWATATEINNAGFELQRSVDGVNFSRLVFVASRASNGNSVNKVSYSFDDVRPLAGNGYYRLKQMDKDGKTTTSKVILIKGAKLNAISFTSVYPNPVKDKLNTIISSPVVEVVQLMITDLNGKVLNRQATSLVIGDNKISLPVSRLSSGTYFIKATCANGCETAVQKFVKR
jgi:hypothetical protein